MDRYYQNLAKVNSIPKNDQCLIDDVYCLILSGNPKGFIHDIYHNSKPLSVRPFLSKNIQLKNNTRNIYINHAYKSENNNCSKCAVYTKCVKYIQPDNGNKCGPCSKPLIKKSIQMGINYGKQVHRSYFHHYYIFSYCDLLKDIKFLIREFLFSIKDPL